MFVSFPQVRILDLYLLEGPKLFYRFALSAVKHFVSSSGFENYKTSKQAFISSSPRLFLASTTLTTMYTVTYSLLLLK